MTRSEKMHRYADRLWRRDNQASFCARIHRAKGETIPEYLRRKENAKCGT